MGNMIARLDNITFLMVNKSMICVNRILGYFLFYNEQTPRAFAITLKFI